MELTITFKEVNDMRAKIDEQAATIARLTAAQQDAMKLTDEIILRQAENIQKLKDTNESMQEDAVQNTYAFNLMLTANKAQAVEIERLTEKVRYAYVQIEALERVK